MEKLVSIITVNYNGLCDTCAMIESLRQYETHPYEIIVVDNGSTQPEGDEIARLYPSVKVVRNKNTGFAGGNNAGLKVAQGEYIFFLNNDTEIKEPILKNLIKRLEASPHNGGVSPMLRYYYQPDVLQYAGFTEMSRITLRNQAIGFGEKANAHLSPTLTASLHGAAMMVPKKVLEEVGPMTEIYFLFYEELDWSERIKEAGYQLWYESASMVYHKEGKSSKKGSPLREFYLSRARMIFARRNRKGLQLLLSTFYLLCIAMPKKALSYLLQGKTKLSMASIKGSWKGLNESL